MVKLNYQLYYTMTALVRNNEIASYTRLSEDKVVVNITEDAPKLTIFMPGDYVITQEIVREGVSSQPFPDYIAHNNWQRVSDAAVQEAENKHVKIISYGRLRYIIEKYR